MLMRSTYWRACGLAAAIVLITVAACSKEESATKDTEAKAKQAAGLVPGQAATDEAAVLAKLVLADELDGTADKIVKRCPGCALKMDGKSEHATEVSGYAIHFCSGSCQEEFAKDLTKSILALEIPKP